MIDTKEGFKGITLIALVITIILLLILAGITISQLTGNGLFGKAKDAKTKYEEVQAREKLELVLLKLQSDKITNEEYDEKEYIDNELKENGIQIEDDVATVNGWKFRIDRSVPKIDNEKVQIDKTKVVPIMEDYESNEGKVIYSPQQADRYPAWQCFDGKNSTGFSYNYSYPCYLGYEFYTNDKLLIYKVGIAGRYSECPKDFSVKVYNNNEWVTVFSGVMQNPEEDYKWQYFDIETNLTGQKFMVEFTSSYNTSECSIRNVQFYTINDSIR